MRFHPWTLLVLLGPLSATAGDGAYAQDVQVYPKGDSFVLFDWAE